MQSDCIREASKACFNTCCTNPLALPHPHTSPPASTSTATSSAADPRRSFVSAILSSIQPKTNFTNHESLPSLHELLTSLKNAVPNYLNTVLADAIRDQEYRHLTVSNRVFLDYVGHGLFSQSQREEAQFFDVSYTTVRLNSYLMYGNQESRFQSSIRERIMRYMNVHEDDYSSVFTANQSSAFKIVADSYPFHSNRGILTVYDYENDAVEVMIERAKTRGARPYTALFSWPNLRINSRKLRKIVVGKSKRRNRGIFVFPLQSRTSGARYPYQWMNLARENGWHVLLDASALGAKEMETLGLSLFQPDFIICSFYKIFGENPSGFCCLFIKKSSVADLSQSSTSMGIVSITQSRNPGGKSQFRETASFDESRNPAEKSAIDGSEQISEEFQETASFDESRNPADKSAIDGFGQISGEIQETTSFELRNPAEKSEFRETALFDESRNPADKSAIEGSGQISEEIQETTSFELRNPAEQTEIRETASFDESRNPADKSAIDGSEQISEEFQETTPYSEIVEVSDSRISSSYKSAINYEYGQISEESQQTASFSETVEADESRIECRALDHADTLGLILISSRVRYLVNWLVNAMLSLRHPNSTNGLPLIAIYGPKIKLDRGPAIAFNVYDWKGERVDPNLVQKLADRNNISLALGFLKNVCFSEEFQEEKCRVMENRGSKLEKGEKKRRKEDCGIRVVSISLVMLSNFEDIYRVWGFVSRFLDADFVEKERWRYTALNQTTVEV